MTTMHPFMNPPAFIVTLDVDHTLQQRLTDCVAHHVTLVELNSHDPALFQHLKKDFPSLCIGAGHIINAEQLEHCHLAHLPFATSPGLLPALVHTADLYHLPYLPSIATFSEAMQAHALGCTHIRPLPATLSFCTQLSRYFPQLALFPAEVLPHESTALSQLPTVKSLFLTEIAFKQTAVQA